MEDREDDEYGVRRIQVNGVVVRYVQDSWSIMITVEGALPQDAIDALVEDARGKLALLENAECDARRLGA